ncbi:dihydrodipicolinate synthase family protein [Natronolimnobius sp. AArcel1]|uniref:dihydrodipicolinate synthase family protein n=1 Tax=Natronolimnobius sp. AArcel1 TaxID=1679093 RepID=UPI0013EC884A|nr:dihydrodipicolinate synthase family protein [Natronolimnobius sp. AArcel1]NGM71152.1 dihydrodipicolinate synthase family protein [Natronolimnobius sp. AArcel1]
MPTTGPTHDVSIRGVLPPTITAYTADEELDLEATAAHARFVVDRGVHGVFPLGTNGEFPMLKPDERAAVIGAVVDEVGDEVPVIAGVSAPSTRNTVSYALDAEASGADAVVVGIPYYYPIDSAAIVEHYEEVTDAVDIPVYIYHFPARMGNKLELETLDRIAAIDGIVGVKDSSGDVAWLGQAIDQNPDLTYLAGLDSLLFAELEIGCTGLVSAVSNIFPELTVDLYESYVEGEEAHARELQSTVFDIWKAVDRGPYLGGVKSALDLHPEVEFDPGPMRRPLQRMSDREEVQLERTLRTLDLI